MYVSSHLFLMVLCLLLVASNLIVELVNVFFVLLHLLCPKHHIFLHVHVHVRARRCIIAILHTFYAYHDYTTGA